MDLPGRLVLLGHPVAHSLSPVMQNAALRSAGIPLTYEAMDVTPARLATVAGLLRDADGAGNVTVPHKEAFAALCAARTPVAERAGAVNTFWTDAGALTGDNTDVGGFDAAVRRHFGLPHDHGTVVVLGAGDPPQPCSPRSNAGTVPAPASSPGRTSARPSSPRGSRASPRCSSTWRAR